MAATELSSPLTVEPHVRVTRRASPGRRNAGRWLIVISSCAFGLVVVAQALRGAGIIEPGFDTWRPTLYAYLAWSIALGCGLVMTKGERGHQLLFLLPALLFTVAVVIFPTFFGLYIAFTDWNLSSVSGRRFNGLDNIRALLRDAKRHAIPLLLRLSRLRLRLRQPRPRRAELSGGDVKIGLGSIVLLTRDQPIFAHAFGTIKILPGSIQVRFGPGDLRFGGVDRRLRRADLRRHSFQLRLSRIEACFSRSDFRFGLNRFEADE